MDIFATLELTTLDAAAFAWFLTCTLGYNLLTRGGALRHRSLLGAIQVQRLKWFSHMGRRDDRFMDVALVGNLASGNTFFASTSVILLGVLSALLGSGERAQAVIDRLPFTVHSPPALWDLKILLMMVVFVYAFFKFAWAFRLAHYAMIMVGATPPTGTATDAECAAHAERTARLAGIAAEHGNLGLRAYYFAMAAIGWFFSPVIFLAATTFVVLIITRREYFSRSLAAIAGPRAGDRASGK